MDQDRREAQLWASEWQIRQKRNRIITILAVIAAIAAIGVLIHYISIFVGRTTYSSEEEMKQALQGRFETDYASDITIDGDTVILTYYNPSHYSVEFAEQYGYSEAEDSVYEDTIEKWNYRTGEIKCHWMDPIIVDKAGNLVYLEQKYVKTDAPKPVPIDPSDLSLYKKGYEDSEKANSEAAEEGTEADTEEEPELNEEMLETEESKAATEAAAEDAGIEAIAGGSPE